MIAKIIPEYAQPIAAMQYMSDVRIEAIKQRLQNAKLSPDWQKRSLDFFIISEWLLTYAETHFVQYLENIERLMDCQDKDLPYIPAISADHRLITDDALSVDDVTYSKNLRLSFNREMAAVIMAELMAVNDTQATMDAMTLIAEDCLQCACAHAGAQLAIKHGFPDVDFSDQKDEKYNNHNVSRWQNNGFVVLGMGKLGGKELNLSSDIDVIFAFHKEGMTKAEEGQRSVSHSQFYTKLAQRVIRLLDEVTEYGRVFRVDARLRPHGDSGPLVMSFAAMENYYQLHGREWERYAWIKARCVAGDVLKANLLLKILKPFVYRKYVDYRIVRSIKNMRDMIYLELKQKGIEQNIKLGRGGIRMIEFVVQTYQLLYGGRYPALKNYALYPSLQQIENMQMINREQASKLYQAYLFLRTVEHRIQMYQCEQTHDLPNDMTAQARIAWSLHYSSVEAFNDDLQAYRDYVQQVFDNLTDMDDGVDNNKSKQSGYSELSQVELSHNKAIDTQSAQTDMATYVLAWQKLINDDNVDDLIKQNSFLSTPIVAELKSYIHGKSYGLMSANGKDILQSLIPKLMHYCSLRNDGHISIRRCLKVINSIGQRVLYLELLNSHSTVCQNFVDYVSASQWVCQWLANYPIVIEMLLEKNQLSFADTLKAYREALESRIHGNVDVELVMDVLRQFHHGQVLKIALNDVQKLSPVLAKKQYDLAVIEQVYDIRFKLSILAQSLIESALRLACEQLKEKFGVEFSTIETSFAIIAYGKLGTEELSYDSDLDLVFVFDETCDLGRVDIDRSYYFIRLARKLISILSLPTSSGILYEIDSRLRPSGNSGLLVTSIAKFERYQKQEAWVWEHQALQKSRMIFGNDGFISNFERIRQSILSLSRDSSQLLPEVANMRQKMKQQSDATRHKHGLSFKYMDGGLVDIEFFCQYMVLNYAHQYPLLAQSRKVKNVLEALCELGLISEKNKKSLADFYTLLLFLENHEKLFVQNNHDSTILQNVSHQTKVVDERLAEETNKLASKDCYTIDHQQKDKESTDADLALAYFQQTHDDVTSFCQQFFNEHNTTS